MTCHGKNAMSWYSDWIVVGIPAKAFGLNSAVLAPHLWKSIAPLMNVEVEETEDERELVVPLVFAELVVLSCEWLSPKSEAEPPLEFMFVVSVVACAPDVPSANVYITRCCAPTEPWIGMWVPKVRKNSSIACGQMGLAKHNISLTPEPVWVTASSDTQNSLMVLSRLSVAVIALSTNSSVKEHRVMGQYVKSSPYREHLWSVSQERHLYLPGVGAQ